MNRATSPSGFKEITPRQSFSRISIFMQKELPCFWNSTYTVWYSIFYSKFVDCIFFLKIVEMQVPFVQDRRTFRSFERNISISARSSEVSQIFPHFTLMSTEREVMSPCFIKCGEPWYRFQIYKHWYDFQEPQLSLENLFTLENKNHLVNRNFLTV